MNNTIQECYKYYRNLREEMDRWLKQSMRLDPPGPNGGGEDEANYALAWFPHYLVTGNQTVLQHFKHLKSALAGWVKRECLHGYEPEAEDPYNDPGAAAISYYRWTFQDTAFDSQIRERLKAIPPSPPEQLALIFPQKTARREPGVGRRSDMAYWGAWSDDGSVKPIREPSTAALTLAYQVTGDAEFAMGAFRSASTRLGIARRVLRGGREHADMGGAVCSVAAGHGRSW
ncbi:hypothetical protein HYR99_36305, partial [Candidatus Poribacteria bacterium]|nr:hypothetical protein [Candidatus Poribacteria bacterium]